MYIDDCLDATIHLARSEWSGPVNIGTEEMVSINQLATMVMEIAGKRLEIQCVKGPLGVRGRNSQNDLYEKMLGWRPRSDLLSGVEKTYPWIEQMVRAQQRVA